MNGETVASMLAILALLAYCVYAVKFRHDRRKVPTDMMHLLYAVSGLGASVIILGVVLNAAVSERVTAVKDMTSYGAIVAVLAVAVALRILKGAPYDRR